MEWHKGQEQFNDNPPRMIFCLTTGRSGTAYLAQVMATVPNVQSRHEPPPGWYAEQTRPYQERLDWLLEEKLPTIDRITWQGDTYMESANQINQGFIEPLLEIGVPFDAIWLKRDTQEVAVSFWRKAIIPGRTSLAWHMPPDHEDNILRAKRWAHWTDYTCCLWLAMEKEARNEKYAPMIRQAGGQVVETTTGEIISEAGFMKLLADLDLPMPNGQYHEVKNRKFNASSEAQYKSWPPEGFGKQREWILNDVC